MAINTYLELKARIQVLALLPHGGPFRRQLIIPRLAPVVENVVDDLGDGLDLGVVGKRGGDLGLCEADAGMLEEDGLEEEEARNQVPETRH
jgi:hypothetical protein